MKKILILGGSYFIGKKLVEELLNNKAYEITILNRGSVPAPNGVSQIICDRNDLVQMKTILRNYKFDIVIDISCVLPTQAQILINSISSVNIKKMIFISSSAVYDVDRLLPPFKESDICAYNKFWTDYGQNKIDIETIYSNFAHSQSINLVILRPPYVYGEYNYVQRESFIFSHIEKNSPIIIPKNDFKLHFIYCGALAKAIIFFLTYNNAKQVDIYNVGDSYPISVTQWINECMKIVGKTVPVIKYDYLSDGRNIRDFFPFYDYDNYLDVSKINQLISLNTSMEIGLASAYYWYTNNREAIKFKENIAANEKQIIDSLQ